MKQRILYAIMLILFAVTPVLAATTDIHWIPNNTNQDGTPLTDLAGYEAYCGAVSGNYTITVDIPDPMATNATIDCSTIPEPFIVLIAYDTSGNKSGYSNEVNCDNNSPGNPGGLGCGL